MDTFILTTFFCREPQRIGRTPYSEAGTGLAALRPRESGLELGPALLISVAVEQLETSW